MKFLLCWQTSIYTGRMRTNAQKHDMSQQVLSAAVHNIGTKQIFLPNTITQFAGAVNAD